MGDGTARRSRAAPGYWDERAEGFDAAVLAALAAGDSAALAALDLQLAAELLCAGAPAWAAAGVLLSGRAMDAEVLYAEVPFGVQYIVAGWICPWLTVSWPCSVRPRRASRTWRSSWPCASAARSSTRTPCSSTSAWTSAPPSCRWRPAGESRTICSTSGRSPSRRRWPSTRRWPGRRSPTSTRAGRLPILVGGSGLYLRGALDRLEFPGESPPVRARLERELGEHGAPSLHARLAAVDAEAAAAILPTNGRRIVRALEVIELTGGPFLAANARLRVGLRHGVDRTGP